jgi:LysM repeat protein
MNPSQSSNARIAAIGALAIAFVVLLVVVVSSLGGGGGSSGSAGGAAAPPKSAGQPAKSKPVEAGRKVYVVKPGDTFSAIATKVGISVDKLQRLNPGIDQFTLHSGDRVKLR